MDLFANSYQILNWHLHPRLLNFYGVSDKGVYVMHYDCLVIEDEITIAQSISEYLSMFDIQTEYALNYSDAWKFLKINTVSVVLLDVMLGEDSGLKFCKELREISDVPIIFVSANSMEHDILAGLDLGGDDYVTKPFSLAILLAKVKAILRRGGETAKKTTVTAFGDIVIHPDSFKVEKGGSEVLLKPVEWDLLIYMCNNPKRLISKDELLDNVWKDKDVSEGTIATHIRYLREKLEGDPASPAYIKTVWGKGYLFECDQP